MFGGSSKVGRGGGGGRGGVTKRFSAPLQPPRTSRPTGGRLSLPGGPRNRKPGPASPDPPAVEETFSLVSGNNPFAFAMMIKLAPDLVEEIRRAEAQGETAKIKFDANPKNPTGNLINVGGKEFHFTWSKELGDLCDIYEEKQSGEDGNGLLVESGCSWRKLNVQRILDESATNHVKMLSKEAERKYKARKAIVLDNGNPSTKGQIKQLAAVVATSTWRMGSKRKEPPPKKRKVDPPYVPSGGSLKSAHKPGLTSKSKAAGKVRRAISPLTTSPGQLRSSAFSSDSVNISQSNTITEDSGPAGQLSKDDNTVFEREITAKRSGLATHWSGENILGSEPVDLQSMLISILRNNPKGMSIQALEKSIGYAIPKSGKRILTRIATYQAPGRYLLKPRAELEGLKGPSPGSGSSFEDNHNQEPAYDKDIYETPVLEPISPKEVNRLVQVNPSVPGELDASENVDIEQRSPDHFGINKSFDHIDGQANGSSDGGSDSDSESSSSDCRSYSRSPGRSRGQSKSPVGSGGSSNSDNDAPSNQEGSDEEVDIMTNDDDKVLKHNVQDPRSAFPMTESYCQPVIPQDSTGHHILNPCDSSPEKPIVNGKGSAILQREFSGLELGELYPKEAPSNRPFKRKGSYKQLEKKSNNLKNQSIDCGRGKTPGESNMDLGKSSQLILSRKSTVEHQEDDPVVPVQQGMQSQLEYLSEGDHGGIARICKKVDVIKSTRIGVPQIDSRRDLVPQSLKESKTQAAGTATNTSNRQEAVSADCDSGLKRRESFSDENRCSYSTYEKDKPELKGPIKDLQQYMEYTQEYYGKYDIYCSLNKILEKYRNEFERMGKELYSAKGRDLKRYNHVAAQLRESYALYGSNHKRLKKIFVVLHVELRHLKQMMIEFAQKHSQGSSA